MAVEGGGQWSRWRKWRKRKGRRLTGREGRQWESSLAVGLRKQMLLLRTRPPLLFFTNLRRVRVKKLSDFKEMGLWVLSGSLSSVLREREMREREKNGG